MGAAVLGFGLAGVSVAAPMNFDSSNGATAANADSPPSAARTDAAQAARADAAAAAQAEAAAAAARAAAARAAAAQRADRSSRSAPTPAPAKTNSPRPVTKPAWVHPMRGADVTSCYGYRWGVLHAGIDLAEPAGTPIRAAGGGTVEAAGWVKAGYGISVLIDHGNGYLTHYGHMNRDAVYPGEKVEAGEVIGYEGSTGDSTGPHLHFEVHEGAWNQIDPAPWLRARDIDLNC